MDANLSMTISELKVQVQSKSQIPPEEQRLIYKGQVLKDERTVDSYGETRCSWLAVQISNDEHRHSHFCYALQG